MLQVKNENPEAKLGELAKIIGAKWGEMSDKEKEPYAKKAETEKVRHLQAILAQIRHQI